MDIRKCPKCNGSLGFDLKFGRYVCKECGAIWSYTFNLEDSTMVWREWEVVNLE